MNPLIPLRDAWYFFSRNLSTIALLCLPWVLLENLLAQFIDLWTGESSNVPYSLLAGLLFYPLYSAALILLVDARSRGLQPRMADLLALLTALTSLLILLGISLLVLPGLWVMVKLAFAEYLLVLRGYTPLAALRGSMNLSTGHFWPLLACLLAVLAPLWLLDWWAYQLMAESPSAWLSLLLDSANGFLQLFLTLVMLRYFILIEPPTRAPEQP
jgi:hypothetical protein